MQQEKTISKDIRDYLHLYRNVEVETDHPNYPKALHKCSDEEGAWLWNEPNQYEYFKYKKVKIIPLLRPLSDMTEEEKDESGCHDFNSFYADYTEGLGWIDIDKAAEQIKYLLSKGFDLFGLIDAGRYESS